MIKLSLLHLFALITSSPGLTGPAVHAVHVGGVVLTLHVAVHGAEDVVQMDHLDVVVPTVTGNHRVVVHVDDVEWSVRHEVVPSEWRAADRTY